jgi:hypothetical protein
MWPPNAKLPQSAPAVLNGRCRARLDMSRSSLGVALRGLTARERSVTFPVWRKRCISRTMMEWCTTWLVSISFLIMNLFQIGLLFSLPVHTYLLSCETGYWSIFIYVYMTECVKCHVSLGIVLRGLPARGWSVTFAFEEHTASVVQWWNG